jgi:hypothetical protein
MPKSPIWETEVGPVRVEEYHTNERGTHFEIRIANGPASVVFPHEFKHLWAAFLAVEIHRECPALALEKRGIA